MTGVEWPGTGCSRSGSGILELLFELNPLIGRFGQLLKQPVNPSERTTTGESGLPIPLGYTALRTCSSTTGIPCTTGSQVPARDQPENHATGRNTIIHDAFVA